MFEGKTLPLEVHNMSFVYYIWVEELVYRRRWMGSAVAIGPRR